jgi:hypothetical protein
MTEAEWLACSNPIPMLDSLGDKASDRKVLLFACGCLRQVWPILSDERSRRAVEVAERLVDAKKAKKREFRNIRLDAERVAQSTSSTCLSAYYAARVAVSLPRRLPFSRRLGARYYPGIDSLVNVLDERLSLGDVLRDVFGNPFHCVTVDPVWLSWNGGTVLNLAQTIYDERRFGDLPILADALEDAGCDNANILSHCRDPGEHSRGCWVVDLLLGKV